MEQKPSKAQVLLPISRLSVLTPLVFSASFSSKLTTVTFIYLAILNSPPWTFKITFNFLTEISIWDR